MNFFHSFRHGIFARVGAFHVRNLTHTKRMIMRIHLTILAIIITCLQVTAGSVLAQQVSINAKGTPLKTVLQSVGKQTGYQLFYKNNSIKKGGNVTINLKGVPLKHALEQILKDQPLDFEIVEKTIVITEKTAKPETELRQQTITGKVTTIQGEAIAGVTVSVKGTQRATMTNSEGIYRINADESEVLVFSFLSYATQEKTVGKRVQIDVKLMETQANLNEVAIVSTGYQELPKERATGSFVQVNNELLNRRIGTNILDRLEGVASGLLFNRNTVTPNEKLGISIRGRNTIDQNVNASPLVVLDNFPYEGDIANINPNDIESITLLKDAAAASIWGARAGNGVIVITSKKGAFNRPLQIQTNANVTVGAKPDLFYTPNFMKSSDYIDVETFLFNKGFFDSDLTSINKTMVSPVVDLLAKKRANPAMAADIDAQINSLRNVDVRNDYDKYVYRNSVNQQYALSLNGGSNNAAYNVSLGYDNNQTNLLRNNYNRFTLNTQTTFTITPRLEATAGVNYYQTRTANNANDSAFGNYSAGVGNYGTIFPYARLADDNGNHLAVLKQYSQDYVNSMSTLGFLDYNYRPLDEIDLADNTTRLKSLILRGTLKYKFTSYLNAQVQYQSETQNSITRNLQSQDVYYTRYLINRFAQRNATTGVFTYPVPLGGILDLNDNELNAQNLRAQVNYNQTFAQKHMVTAIAGAEIREVETTGYFRTSYGYNDELGSAITNLNYGTSYPINPTGSATITAPSGAVSGTINRQISYYANASYTYNDKYTLNLSARKDGANIFGVKANDRVTPLWSAGLGWELSKESFYHLAFLPYAKLRATYGFNGNVYNASAYLTFLSANTDALTGLRYAPIGRAPNSNLSWERVKNINLGLDFATKNNIINGTIEFYLKDGLDLIQSTPLAPSTGFSSYSGNAASTRNKGVDIILNSKNIDGAFKWQSNLLFSYLKDKITYYDTKYSTAQLIAGASQFNLGYPATLYPTVGRSLFGIYSYQWAGLDPATGDPQGYLNGEISKNWQNIISNATPESIIYHGSARPTIFGAFRNTFSYKNFDLSVNITYKLGYYFRRTTTGTNMQSTLLRLTSNADFYRRWQQSGDEVITDVPSVVYPANTNRDAFYQGASILVERADHVRLQDISIAYNLNKSQWSKLPLRALQVNVYANNLGLLWTKNKRGIDPDYTAVYSMPVPKTLSIGLRGTF